MTDKIIVLSTCGSAAEAAQLARRLIEKRLAACVNVVPGVRSYYRWKGAVEEAGEFLLIVKSSRAHFERLRTELESGHSYEIPEILALPVTDGSAAYLAWVSGELLSLADGE
jgi:periplasmic divalent cation tolerance protein